jgi:hypothetical protein
MVIHTQTKKGGILRETITKEKLLEIIKRTRKKPPHILSSSSTHTNTSQTQKKKKNPNSTITFFFLERSAAAHRLKKNNPDQQPSPSFPKHSVKKKTKNKRHVMPTLAFILPQVMTNTHNSFIL